MSGAEPLAGVAHRRNELEEAMQAIEREAAAPSASADWSTDLSAAVRQLQTALHDHIRHVEAPGALLEQIMETAPRLQRAVEETRNHHAVLAHSVADLLNLLAVGDKGETTPVAEIRANVIEILNELARHRQDGADLIYEAYDVDIGGY